MVAPKNAIYGIHGSRESSFFTLWMGDYARLLVPNAVFDALEKEATEADQVREPKPAAKTAPFSYTDREDSGDLASIRAGTEHDLADAQALAAKVFKRTKSTLDAVALEFSKDLFVAVALFFVYREKVCNFPLMLSFLTDPGWDSSRQMLDNLRPEHDCLSPAAREFLWAFFKKSECLGRNAKGMVARCVTHWSAALSPTGKLPKEKRPARSIPIFQPEAVAKAITMVGDLRDENKAGGERILANAQHNGGYRAIPDTNKAVEKLEEAKGKFENLVEPITRLQVDLTLSGAMSPKNFRITPILLLGNPGIGKTFLATSLASALSVKSEKISAGGAQGSFQLTGSHPSWREARAGSLFTLLAEGNSASPVMVVDEVDKIGDSQYPVLPVLLDLFEPDTARNFKDEFFEIAFDASRVIFVLTANSLHGIPEPLLSRLEVFDVPRPEPAQRLRIIQAEVERLRRETRTQIELDKSVAENLADRVDIDLRKTTRLVKEAFSKALVSGEKIARFALPKFQGPRRIGFGC